MTRRAWQEWIRSVYGADLAEPAGVLHVTAVWGAPDGRLVTLKILPETPASPGDRRALGLARARVDAIVTSGRILREEPGLTHAFVADDAECAGLAAWRREVLGKTAAPRSLVLTSGRDLDLAHPLFAAPGAVVFTGEEAAARLAPAAGSRGVEVVGHPRPGLRAALTWLRARGLRDVTVEAGPTTSLGLYDEPACVDELMLSVFEQPRLAAAIQGPPFLEPRRLEALTRLAHAPHRSTEPSGRWRFERRLRR